MTPPTTTTKTATDTTSARANVDTNTNTNANATNSRAASATSVPTLDELHRLAESGETVMLRERLAVVQSVDHPDHDDCLALGRLFEDLGLTRFAEREYRAVIDSDSGSRTDVDTTSASTSDGDTDAKSATEESSASSTSTTDDPTPDAVHAVHALLALLDDHGRLRDAVDLLLTRLDARPTDIDLLRAAVPRLRVAGRHDEVERRLLHARDAGVAPEVLARLAGMDEATASRATEPQTRSVNDDAESPSTSTSASPADAAPTLNAPTDADLVRFLDRFTGREDVHARQWSDAERGVGYTPVREPLHVEHLRRHVLGVDTVGIYLLRRDHTVRLFVLDIDVTTKSLAGSLTDATRIGHIRDELRRVTTAWRQALVDLGFHPVVEDSAGKGRHLWCLLDAPVDARLVHDFGQRLLVHRGVATDAPISVEFFPKQGRLRHDGLGNLVKLPLGVHRRTGRRSCFVDADDHVVDDPWSILRETSAANGANVGAAIRTLSGEDDDALSHAASPISSSTSGANSPATTAPPAFAESAPRWTAGHFESDPEVAHLLASCPVLRTLKEKAIRLGRLDYDEQLVLRHSLGHLHQGVDAVNWLFDRCTDIDSRNRMHNALRGSPTSCAKVRRRVAGVAEIVGCECPFPDSRDTYANPLLHLRELRERDVERREVGSTREMEGESNAAVAVPGDETTSSTSVPTDPVAASEPVDTTASIDTSPLGDDSTVHAAAELEIDRLVGAWNVLRRDPERHADELVVVERALLGWVESGESLMLHDGTLRRRDRDGFVHLEWDSNLDVDTDVTTTVNPIANPTALSSSLALVPYVEPGSPRPTSRHHRGPSSPSQEA